MSKPNLHVGLALALGVQPDRSDKQLLGMVEDLVRRTHGAPAVLEARKPRPDSTSPLFDLRAAS